MEQLEIRGLNTYYGESHILRDVDLTVNSGEMVCLIGRNGVGKTTLLKSIIGLLKPRSGQINFAEQCLDRQPPHQRARAGVGYVPQGREIIPQLTVEENLLLGLEARPGGMGRQKRIDPFVYELFPILRDFLPRKGGDLSGGQQQQLAIARALMGKPSLLLLDEPTEGIQPNMFKTLNKRFSASFVSRESACCWWSSTCISCAKPTGITRCSVAELWPVAPPPNSAKTWWRSSSASEQQH